MRWITSNKWAPPAAEQHKKSQPMRLAALTALLSLFVAATSSAAATKDSERPDKEMLQMMELLKNMEMIKQIELMQDMQKVESSAEPGAGATSRKFPAAKKRESTK